VIEQSLPGYAGLRLLIDMQWTQDTGLPADKLCHWEATLEYLLSDVATVQAMCQYDRRLPPAALHAALRTHPYSLYGGRSAPSPFYEAARVLEDEPNFEPCSNDASLVGQMLREVHPDLT
ncbi:MAG TPA: MEDS domain-containing protein, partial [Dehalococcoidia bacterium]|nr:MEDS domain-containing protein [Dehalococcoidia bacterium]